MEEVAEVRNTDEPEQPPADGSSRANQARQLAVNFMPSRQLPYNTLRHRRNNSEHNGLLDETDNGEANEDGDGENAEDHNPEEKRAEIIVKGLEQQQELMEDNPLSEELRREVLRDLPQGLTMKRNIRAKLSVSVSLRSTRRPISVLKRTKYRMSFAWKRAKERTHDAMFSVELWYEAIRNIEGQFGSAVGSYFRMVRRLFVLDLALAVLLVCFLVIPQALHDIATARVDIKYWGIVDWITGRGGMQATLMYYGHYHSGDVGSGGLGYSMPFAYFFTMVCLYLVFFAGLCYGTAYSYKRNFIETAGGLSHVFANKVFCGWDFGIMSAHAAQLNARSIYNELKELLSEQDKKPAALSIATKLGQRVANILVMGLVLVSIGGVLFGLWNLLETLGHWEISVSALLIVVVSLCPLFFHLIGRLEFYTPRTALYVALGRTWLLDVSILMLVFVFWAHSGRECWETRFGQEVYRLVLLDAMVSLLVLPAIEIFRALLYKFRPSGSPPEFNIEYNSLTLIYNQSVLWFGMLFSPLLAVAVTVKFLFLFYVKRECAVRACQPARKVWRAAQTQTVLYMLVTLSLFTTLLGIGSIFLRMPSQQCGPFREYPYVFAVVSEGVLHLHENECVSRALSWLCRPGVLGFVLVLLCVLVYYGRARARAQQSMVRILRHMLVLQAQDKDFLLAAIGKVANGEWLYSPKAVAPGTHTERFVREVRKPSNSSFHFDASRLSRSFADRPASGERGVDGDTDSSFSWQGSGNNLNNSP